LTFAAFLRKPGRSAQKWQSGETTFMNPLGFGATAAGFYWAITSLLTALWPTPGPNLADTLSDQITSALGPYLHYGLLGLTMHIALRSLGSRRHVLGSIGAAFFCGGSLGTLVALAWTALARGFAHARGTNSLELGGGDSVTLILLIGAVASYGLLCLTIGRALMALHRTAVWKALLATVFAIVATSVLFGSLIPSGDYGWHPYVRIQLNGEISFGFQG
jgi:hypothetical protein